MLRTLISFFSLVVFMWTTADGVVCFTDDLKKVPQAYAAEAVARDWADIRAEARWTRVDQ